VGFAPDDTALITDGGLATELEARGHDLSGSGPTGLWSARLLVDAPQEITAVHLAFFRAGAMIATTASYQASFEAFAANGISRDDTVRLLRRSVELAKTARNEADEVGVAGGVGDRKRGGAGRSGSPTKQRVGDRKRGDAGRSGSPTKQRVGDRKRGDAGRSGSPTKQRRVAASVGPYGAALADGSEYRGRYGLSVAQLEAWHRPRLEVLADAGADVLALETIPDVDEAEALVNLVRSLGVPAWLSYTINGTRTRAGQPLADAFAVTAGVPEIVAVGVNCCAPDDVLPAIRPARETGKPVIVYPNSGERWDSGRRRWVGPSRFSSRLGLQWVSAGATVVGGCCRVRPADIADLAAALT
jgi:homocysteine S-methyltransferase